MGYATSHVMLAPTPQPRRWVKDREVRDAAGIMSGIDLAASFARVYFGEEIEIEGGDSDV